MVWGWFLISLRFQGWNCYKLLLLNTEGVVKKKRARVVRVLIKRADEFLACLGQRLLPRSPRETRITMGSWA